MKISTKNHRSDFETCPSCEARFKDGEWEGTAFYFSAKVYFGKHDSGVVGSKCPFCKFESWIHRKLSSVGYIYSFRNWSKRAEKELRRRRLQALRDWRDSLCACCGCLDDASVDTSTSKECSCGNWSSTGPVEMEKCEYYEPEE